MNVAASSSSPAAVHPSRHPTPAGGQPGDPHPPCRSRCRPGGVVHGAHLEGGGAEVWGVRASHRFALRRVLASGVLLVSLQTMEGRLSMLRPRCGLVYDLGRCDLPRCHPGPCALTRVGWQGERVRELLDDPEAEHE